MTVECGRCGGLGDLTATPVCGLCGWNPVVENGVVNVLTETDLASPILASYFNNYDRIAHDDLHAPILSLSYVAHQALNLARYVGDVTGLSIMDLGCGQGYLTRLLKERGARRIAAVDISRAYLQRLAGLPDVIPILANAERLPFREAFDVVVSTDVMEHVLNLGSSLVSVNQSLRVQGTAIIRVPYRESLIGYSAQAGCSYEFVHLRTFDRRTLSDALGSAGFVVERIWLDGFSIQSPRPIWIAARWRQHVYNQLQSWVLRWTSDPAEVTSWPWPLAALFMEPKEIVVRARKVKPVTF